MSRRRGVVETKDQESPRIIIAFQKLPSFHPSSTLSQKNASDLDPPQYTSTSRPSTQCHLHQRQYITPRAHKRQTQKRMTIRSITRSRRAHRRLIATTSLDAILVPTSPTTIAHALSVLPPPTSLATTGMRFSSTTTSSSSSSLHYRNDPDEMMRGIFDDDDDDDMWHPAAEYYLEVYDDDDDDDDVIDPLIPTTSSESTTSTSSSGTTFANDIVETAKAFVPVAMEFAAVAALSNYFD